MVTTAAQSPVTGVQPPGLFDCDRFFAAVDARRRELALDWNGAAADLYEQSFDLNARLLDHGVCPGAVVRVRDRGTISCQYALVMLRWIDRPPEDFLAIPGGDVGSTRLPVAGPDSRLRWSLAEVHAALDERRQEQGLTWAELGRAFECSPSRLTNLRTARLADMDLVMRVTQWLGRPAADFIHPADW